MNTAEPKSHKSRRLKKVEKQKAAQIISQLFKSFEEEEICISLLTTYYRNPAELHFFNSEDRKRVEAILDRLAGDSQHHRTRIQTLIRCLEEKVA